MFENKIIADLHIHSRFARATSNKINVENLVKFAKIKGVNLLGTGDFQHPKWFKELDKLEERQGILYYENFPFLWQTEISLMYKQDKMRKVHHVILVPNKEVVKQAINFLKSKGRLDYDGRPIFGFSSVELVESLKEISKGIEIIPAHCLTPWFGIFGSKSGFDNLKECFKDKSKEINAVESGMSADPEMLRKFSFLNDKAVVSFSDSHSFWPWRMGREATVFDKLDYKDIIKQIRENSFLATIETDPRYGRYHYDGHRKCNFSSSPAKTKDLNGKCPKCGKHLTIGVENRVKELGDQESEEYNEKKYYKLLPLHEVISLYKNKGISTKTVWRIYYKLIERFGSEFNVLFNVGEEALKRFLDKEQDLVKLILMNRNGKINFKPGFDGSYGEAVLEEKQDSLSNF